MDKVVLVLDMPEKCEDCDICASWQSSSLSVREYWCPVMDNNEVDPLEKPRWCPLKEIPEKDTRGDLLDEYYDGFTDGWNACVDEILG